VEAGLRRGELLGLRWSSVRVPQRRLIIERAVWPAPGGERVEQLPKGGREHRAAISADLADELAAWHAESVVAAGAAATGLVWPGREGRPLAVSSVTAILRRASRRAGLVDEDGTPSSLCTASVTPLPASRSPAACRSPPSPRSSVTATP
jgi:integrase